MRTIDQRDWDLSEREAEAAGEDLTPGQRITRNTERFLDDWLRDLVPLLDPDPAICIAGALPSTRTALAALQAGDTKTAKLFLPDVIQQLELAAARLATEAAR
jgi:hypothetical protein